MQESYKLCISALKFLNASDVSKVNFHSDNALKLFFFLFYTN